MVNTFRLLLVMGAVISLALSANGKRKAPKPVAPVNVNGVQYSASGNGEDELVIATDAISGRELWRITVFHNRIDPLLERDVQDVFITDLRIVGVSLIVTDEKFRMFSINLKTKTSIELIL